MHNYKLSYNASTYLLQAAYASPTRSYNYDVTVLDTLGFGEVAETTAIEELQAAGVLEHGEFVGRLSLTKKGWTLIRKKWPKGQLPSTKKGPTVVIGSFDSAWDLPVRWAVPIATLTDVIPNGSRFAAEVELHSLRCNAWELAYPPNGQTEDRILVRIEEGSGTVLKSPTEADEGHVFGVRPGTWLSIDRIGRCRESHRTLEEMIFLIAMKAA